MPTKWNKILRSGVGGENTVYDDEQVTEYDHVNVAYDGVYSIEPTEWTKRTTP